MSMDERMPNENEPTAKPEDAEGQTTPEAAPVPPAAEGEPRPRRRGFAAMDRDRVKEIASRGGRAAHAAGTAHQFNSDEARVAGKKGGEAPHVRRGGVRRRPTPEPTSGPTSQTRNDGR